MKNITLFNSLLVSASAIVLVSSYMAISHPKIYSRHGLSPQIQAQVDRANLLLKQGQQERREGDLVEAEADLKECLAEDTASNQFARQELAQVYESEGRTNAALQVYQAMLHPPANEGNGGTFAQDGFVLIHYALALNEMGRWAEAVQAYEEILENPNMPDNFKNTDPNEPRIEVHFDPSIPQTNEMKAMLHVVLGRRFGHNYKEALPQFEAARAIDPNLAIAQYYTGYALQAQGQYAAAQAAYKKAAQLDTEGTVKAAAERNLQAVGSTR